MLKFFEIVRFKNILNISIRYQIFLIQIYYIKIPLNISELFWYVKI